MPQLMIVSFVPGRGSVFPCTSLASFVRAALATPYLGSVLLADDVWLECGMRCLAWVKDALRRSLVNHVSVAASWTAHGGEVAGE